MSVASENISVLPNSHVTTDLSVFCHLGKSARKVLSSIETRLADARRCDVFDLGPDAELARRHWRRLKTYTREFIVKFLLEREASYLRIAERGAAFRRAEKHCELLGNLARADLLDAIEWRRVWSSRHRDAVNATKRTSAPSLVATWLADERAVSTVVDVPSLPISEEWLEHGSFGACSRENEIGFGPDLLMKDEDFMSKRQSVDQPSGDGTMNLNNGDEETGAQLNPPDSLLSDGLTRLVHDAYDSRYDISANDGHREVATGIESAENGSENDELLRRSYIDGEFTPNGVKDEESIQRGGGSVQRRIPSESTNAFLVFKNRRSK